MKKIFSDIINIISSLTVNEIVFFTSVMGLLILAVTMIYLIKIGRSTDDELTSTSSEDFSDELLTELTQKNSEETDILPRAADEPDTLIDLKTLTANLENTEYDAPNSKYEKEQEEKAIISYDELIKTNTALKINYTEESVDEGITVKKVDMENITSISDIDEITDTIKTPTVTLVSYEKEEAFLKALKDLQELLS